jgi:hypothetical protein
MTDDRKGGIALIVASVANIITMALHPTGHQLISAGSSFGRVASLARGVHSLALIAMAISFAGALALVRRLNASNRLAIVAIVFYAFAMIAGMMAVVFSGFLGPGLTEKIVATEGQPVNETWKILMAFDFGLNQTFARVLALGSSLAILLWSLAMWKQNALSKELAVYGVLAGSSIIILVAPGFLPLNVHGFGLVVLLQSVWFISVGSLMMRQVPESSAFPAKS